MENGHAYIKRHVRFIESERSATEFYRFQGTFTYLVVLTFG